MTINRAYPGHRLYIYAWISNQFSTDDVPEEQKCYLKLLSGRLMVKVPLDGQKIKRPYTEIIRAISYIFMRGFQNNLAQMIPLRSRNAI